MLSRAPIPSTEQVDSDAEGFVQAVIDQLPATKDRLELFRKAQMDDPICSKVIKTEWPARYVVKGSLLKYWAERFKLNNLLLYGQRLVPQKLQQEVLEKIHHVTPRNPALSFTSVYIRSVARIIEWNGEIVPYLHEEYPITSSATPAVKPTKSSGNELLQIYSSSTYLWWTITSDTWKSRNLPQQNLPA